MPGLGIGISISVGAAGKVGVPDITLPYAFTPPASGAWAAPWVAPTWAGKQNTPTLGAELLTDPSLEATYTAGLCDSFIAPPVGSATVSQSADARTGSKAQAYTGAALHDELVVHPALPSAAQTWHLFSCWGKRTVTGDNRVMPTCDQPSGIPVDSSKGMPWTSATYEERRIPRLSISTDQIGVSVAYNFFIGGTDTCIFDDMSLKIFDAATLFGLIKATGHATVKAKWTWNYTLGGVCGVVARADASSNPQNFLLAFHYLQNQAPYEYCVLLKCVNGTYTQLIADWSNGGGAGSGTPTAPTEWLEIRNPSGNTFQLFHNNIQVGTDQTVAGMTGEYAGVFDTGGSQLEALEVS